MCSCYNLPLKRETIYTRMVFLFRECYERSTLKHIHAALCRMASTLNDNTIIIILKVILILWWIYNRARFRCCAVAPAQHFREIVHLRNTRRRHVALSRNAHVKLRNTFHRRLKICGGFVLFQPNPEKTIWVSFCSP